MSLCVQAAAGSSWPPSCGKPAGDQADSRDEESGAGVEGRIAPACRIEDERPSGCRPRPARTGEYARQDHRHLFPDDKAVTARGPRDRDADADLLRPACDRIRERAVDPDRAQ